MQPVEEGQAEGLGEGLGLLVSDGLAVGLRVALGEGEEWLAVGLRVTLGEEEALGLRERSCRRRGGGG